MKMRHLAIFNLAAMLVIIPATCMNCYSIYLRWCSPPEPMITFDAGEGITLTYDDTTRTYTARISDDPKPQIQLFADPGIDLIYDEPNNVVRARLSDMDPRIIVPQTAEPPVTWKDVEVLWTNQGNSPRP